MKTKKYTQKKERKDMRMYFQGDNLHYKHKHTHKKKEKIQEHSFDQGI